MTTIYETRNGAKCVHTGSNGSKGAVREGKFGGTYVRMQMLPAHPQRFEYINETNLRPMKEEL